MASKTLFWALTGAASMSATAQAEVVTYVVAGQINTVWTDQSQFAPAVAGTTVGDTFELRLTFDSSLGTDTNAHPNRGTYVMPADTYSAQLRIGAATATLPTSSFLRIATNNDFTNPFVSFDVLELTLGDSNGGFFAPDQTLITLVFDIAAMSSAAIPLSTNGSPDASSSFNYSSYLNLNPFQPSPSFFYGGITSFQIIPSPAALAPVASAGLLACARRRRR